MTIFCTCLFALVAVALLLVLAAFIVLIYKQPNYEEREVLKVMRWSRSCERGLLAIVEEGERK